MRPECPLGGLWWGPSGLDARSDRYTYDPNAAGRCLDEWRSAPACDDALEIAMARCQSAFQGKLAVGEPCLASLECLAPPLGRARCDSTEGDERHCVRELRQKVGESCDWTCTTTEANSPGFCFSISNPRGKFTQGYCHKSDGLYCSSQGTCEELIESEGACAHSMECKAGRFCDRASGVCRTRGALGDRCMAASECEETLVCETQVCAAGLEAGSPCVSSDTCISHSCVDGTCLGIASASDVLCAVGADMSGSLEP
jgi:hypothetical protein